MPKNKKTAKEEASKILILQSVNRFNHKISINQFNAIKQKKKKKKRFFFFKILFTLHLSSVNIFFYSILHTNLYLRRLSFPPFSTEISDK